MEFVQPIAFCTPITSVSFLYTVLEDAIILAVISRRRKGCLVEVLLVIGTFGICTGVWTTLVVIIKQNARTNKE